MKIGERYGSLECIGKDTSRDARYYLFKCDCGNVKSIIANNVKIGLSKSCGCYKKLHPSHLTYGFSHTRIDNIYKTMIQRCYSKHSKNYQNYGARGITVCEEWLNDKTKFFDWAFKNGYNENLTIDRIDNSKGCFPDNCRWATYIVQGNNKSSNRYEELNGEIHTLAEWCRIYNIRYSKVHSRLSRGWSFEKAIIN